MTQPIVPTTGTGLGTTASRRVPGPVHRGFGQVCDRRWRGVSSGGLPAGADEPAIPAEVLGEMDAAPRRWR